nr:hypothetical protein [Tanacetum cinerariifolium]
MNDSMIELRKTFQAWLQQQVVNLDSYTPNPSQCQKIPIYYDDDDDEESSTPLRDIIISELPPYEFLKSSVKNLVPNPSKSEDLSNIGSDDDESFSDEDVPKEVYSNPLFDEEIISTKNDMHHFNVESDLIKYFLNQDTSIVSSPEFDSLLEEFFEFNFENSDVVIEFFSPSLIPVEGSDSLMEEIDIFLAPDDSIPSGIEKDDYDSEGNIIFLE